MTKSAERKTEDAGEAAEAAFAAPRHRADGNSFAEHSVPLLQAIYGAGICVLYQNPNLDYLWAENLPVPLQRKWHKFCRDDELFSAELAEQMAAVKKRIISGAGHSGKLEIHLPQKTENAILYPQREQETEAQAAADLEEEARAAIKALQTQTTASPTFSEQNRNMFGTYAQGSQDLWLQFSFEAHRNAQGKLLGLVTTAVNISELRAREDILKILLREVSHRSKNLLAIIQSIAVQTARFCSDKERFLKQFQGRLHSLAASQDLITDSDWHGALLHDLIFAQTHFYTDKRAKGSRFSIDVKGENPYFFPAAALHIGLALHELVINSASFGALARESGAISVTCHALPQESGEIGAFVLTWREQFMQKTGEKSAGKGGAAATEAETDFTAKACGAEGEFGKTVLEKIVPAAVGGASKYSIKNGYIEYILNIPVSQFRS